MSLVNSKVFFLFFLLINELLGPEVEQKTNNDNNIWDQEYNKSYIYDGPPRRTVQTHIAPYYEQNMKFFKMKDKIVISSRKTTPILSFNTKVYF